MSDRTGLALKLEPSDDASELPEAVDLSIADPTDDQILDDQAVQDILESNDKFDLTATFVPHGGLANRLALREALRRLERDTKGATSQHSKPPV